MVHNRSSLVAVRARVPLAVLVAEVLASVLLVSANAQAQPDALKPATKPSKAATAGTRLGVAATQLTPRVVPTDKMLEITASLSLRVTKLDDAIKSLEGMLPAVGGRLQNRIDSVVSFEVDRGRYPEAIEQVAALGVESNRSVEVNDRTFLYLETLAQLRSAQQTRNRIGRLHAGVTGVQDPLKVERALGTWDRRIADLNRRLQQLKRRTDKAVVELRFQPTVGVITEQLPPFQLPFPWLSELGLARLFDLDSKGITTDDDDDDRTLDAAAQVDLHLKAHRAADDELFGGKKTALSFGMTMRGVGETSPVGFAAGTDLELGGGFSGGFLYEYRLLAGIGTKIDKYVAIGTVAGIGISGLTGDHVPFGLDFPIEVFAGFDFVDFLHVSGWARSSWVVGSDDRQDGSEVALFGDEFAAGGSLLLGGKQDNYSHERTGLVISGAYRELMGTHAYQVSLGYGASFVELK